MPWRSWSVRPCSLLHCLVWAATRPTAGLAWKTWNAAPRAAGLPGTPRIHLCAHGEIRPLSVERRSHRVPAIQLLVTYKVLSELVHLLGCPLSILQHLPGQTGVCIHGLSRRSLSQATRQPMRVRRHQWKPTRKKKSKSQAARQGRKREGDKKCDGRSLS